MNVAIAKPLSSQFFYHPHATHEASTQIQGKEAPGQQFRKPFLPPPSIYTTYYNMDKELVLSTSASNEVFKQEISFLESNLKEVSQKRIEALRKAFEEERNVNYWDVAMKTLSLSTSCTALFTGVTFLVTGAGAVAGSLLVISGVLAITNQILQLTGGWEKIKKFIPVDEEEKKQAMILWMQIGVVVIALALGGVGGVYGGSHIKEFMGLAQNLVSPVVSFTGGAVAIELGHSSYRHEMKKADVKRHERQLKIFKDRWEDLVEHVEENAEMLKQFYEGLSRLLDFKTEIFQANQKAMRR